MTAERERLNQNPNIRIELQVEALAPNSTLSDALIPVHIQATVENKGVKEVPFVYQAEAGEQQAPPLMLVSKVDSEKLGGITGQPIPLPYLSIHCPPNKDCLAQTWKRGLLETSGIGYYTFLHPGLAPGLYFIQFQLAVPTAAISKTGNFAPGFVVWTRGRYFQVIDPKVAAMSKAARLAKD